MVAAMAAGCGSNEDTSANGDAATEEGGESGSWDAANMITAVTREEGSGTRGAFTELFGVVDEEDNDMITLDAQTTNSTSVMMTTVSENEYAIGYISLGSLDDSLVKAVKIDGVDATAENIENGTYKVSRPFNVAVKPDSDNAVAKDFMAFIMSTEGQAVVADEGYICRRGSGRKLCSRWFFFRITADGKTDRGLCRSKPERVYRASDI